MSIATLPDVTETEMLAAIVAEAESWIGTPYRHQGTRKQVGADCLGLVRGIWRAIHGTEPETVPAYSPDWAEARGDDALLEAAIRNFVPVEGGMKPGHLVVFRWSATAAAKHAGIIAPGNQLIHAYSGVGVVASPIVPAWRRRIAGVFSFPHPNRG